MELPLHVNELASTQIMLHCWAGSTVALDAFDGAAKSPEQTWIRSGRRRQAAAM